MVEFYIKTYIHKNTFDDKMGRINLVLPDDFEEKFRKEIFKRMGMKKGNLTKAIIEAIEMWMMHPKEIRDIEHESEDSINHLLNIVADEKVPPYVREKAFKKLQKLMDKERK